jgi:hypothetical protein
MTMKLKYIFILPGIYLFFFLLEVLLSELSTYPFSSSILLVDIPLAIVAFIATIIDLPFYLILSLLNFFIKIPYLETIMRLGISIAVYAVIGLSLDLLQNHTRKITL